MRGGFASLAGRNGVTVFGDVAGLKVERGDVHDGLAVVKELHE